LPKMNPVAPNPTLTGNVSLKAVIGTDGTVTYGFDSLGPPGICCLLWVTCTVPVLP
jgi:hypothetical protein